jgi:hypothetical protein
MTFYLHVGTGRRLFGPDELKRYTWSQTSVLFLLSLSCAWSSRSTGKNCNVCLLGGDLSRHRKEVYGKVNVVTPASRSLLAQMGSSNCQASLHSTT